jgi:hypothetical protein
MCVHITDPRETPSLAAKIIREQIIDDLKSRNANHSYHQEEE